MVLLLLEMGLLFNCGAIFVAGEVELAVVLSLKQLRMHFILNVSIVQGVEPQEVIVAPSSTVHLSCPLLDRRDVALLVVTRLLKLLVFFRDDVVMRWSHSAGKIG
jgi:hypothetical protein